ncbi:LysR family transcriptional regulator [Celeribacter sp. ULVN23_4]
MELRHLRYFTVLAETLHFGAAADRLNIVQPALSMQIKNLEEEIGVALFTRSRRNVSLTPAGQLFLVEARRALSHAAQAKYLAQEAGRGVTGQLRLGISAGPVHSGVLRHMMQAFRKTCPGLLVEPVELHPARAPEAILSGDLDASLGTVTSVAVPETLHRHQLASHSAILVLPEDHPLAKEHEIPVERLRQETFVGYAGPDDLPGMSLTAQVLGYVPGFHRTVSSPTMTIGVVAAGLGIAIIPESIKRPEIGAVFRRLKDRQVDIDVTLLWSKTANQTTASALERVLVEMSRNDGGAT